MVASRSFATIEYSVELSRMELRKSTRSSVLISRYTTPVVADWYSWFMSASPPRPVHHRESPGDFLQVIDGGGPRLFGSHSLMSCSCPSGRLARRRASCRVGRR